MKNKKYPILISIISVLVITLIITTLFKKDLIIKKYDNHTTGFQAYDILELGFDYKKEISNQYDTDEFTMDAIIVQPDNVEITIPMFYYQDYSRSIKGDVEYLSYTGYEGWHLRFTPIISGDYKIKIKAQHTKTNKTEYSKTFFYNVRPGTQNGFLRVASDNKRLEFENGNPFIGIGHNLCGWEWAGVDNMAGTFDYDKWFIDLKKNGANMIQFDLCEGDNIEWTKKENELPYSDQYNGVNYFNQMASWKVDYKVKEATNLGLFFRFSLYHWEDFDTELGNFPDWGWSRNPYNVENGGHAKDVADFFVNPSTKKNSKDYIRYCVARWGYSSALMAWELWNEVDSPDMVWGTGKGFHSERNNITAWHQEMGEYLKELDNRHLLTTSFANDGNLDSIWRLDCMDITTLHRYTMYNSSNDGVYESAKFLYNVVNQRTRTYNKPVLIGEFAISPGGDIQRDTDPTGIGFHNQIWGSIFSGSYGNAMHWTWGSYIDRNDLYWQYKPLSTFFTGEDLTGLKSLSNVNINDSYTYFKLYDESKGFIWLKDSNYNYPNVALSNYDPILKTGINIEFDDVRNDDYKILFYDTFTGELISEASKTVTNNNLKINVIDFRRDIAIKFFPLSKVYSSINLGSGRVNDSTFQSGSTISMYTASAEIGGLSDDCRFAYLEVTGDFVYTARVTQTNFMGEFSKAGIMIRNSLTPTSKMVFLGVNGIGQVSVIKRLSSLPAIGQWLDFYIGGYLRFERKGNTINTYISYDGRDYELIEEVEFLNLNNTIYLGVASNSKNTFGYNYSLFENIKLSQ